MDTTKVIILKGVSKDGFRYKKKRIYELPLDVADSLKSEGYAQELEDYFGIESVQGVEDRFRGIEADLDSMTNISNGFYSKDKNSKKIVCIGDSTTELATEMFARFNTYITNGVLGDVTFVNRGCNGNELYKFISDTSPRNNIKDVINDKADLYVLCYGINDIRQGLRTKQQIKDDLKTAIDRLLNETSGYILLRTPNTFLSSDIPATNFLTPIENAQYYSDILWEIYDSFKNYHNRVDLIDMQTEIFGRKAISSSILMSDILHPSIIGQRMIADAIVERITNSKKITIDNKNIIARGTVLSSDSNLLKIQTSYNGKLYKNDIILVGSRTFVIDKEYEYLNNGFEIDIKGDSFSNYGVVRVYRNNVSIKTSDDVEKKWYSFSTSNTYATAHITKVIDMNSLGISGTVDLSLNINGFVTDNNITSYKIGFYANNDPSPSSYTGGSSSVGTGKAIAKGEVVVLSEQKSLLVTNYRYLHIIIFINSNIKDPINFDLTELSLHIDNNSIDTSNYAFMSLFTTYFKYNETSENGIVATEKFVLEKLNNQTTNHDRTWNKFKVSKSSGTDTHFYITLPISQINASGTTSFTLDYDYYTNNTQVKFMYGKIYLNNSSTTITGGTNFAFDSIATVYDSITKYSNSKAFDVSTYSYMHILVSYRILEAGDILGEFGNVKLLVNNADIPLIMSDFEVYAPEDGFKYFKNVLSGDIKINYRDFLNELINLELI